MEAGGRDRKVEGPDLDARVAAPAGLATARWAAASYVRDKRPGGRADGSLRRLEHVGGGAAVAALGGAVLVGRR